jgi:hypothetical protein
VRVPEICNRDSVCATIVRLFFCVFPFTGSSQGLATVKAGGGRTIPPQPVTVADSTVSAALAEILRVFRASEEDLR